MSKPKTLTVRAIVKPSARHVGITSDGEVLRIRVKAPPIEGRANAEAIAVLARAFDVPKTRVELVRGTRSRIKQFRITRPGNLPASFRST